MLTALAVALVVLLYVILYLFRRRGDALVDMVTGLPSRDYFERYLQNCSARIVRRSHYAFGVLMLDIRGFGAMRKAMGRFAAEEILADFAERVYWTIRPMDVLSRLEGDNFAIVLEDVHSVGDVARVAMRVHRSMTEAVTLASTEVEVQLNIGVTIGRAGEPRSAEVLINEANTALTRAIESQRPYVVFDPALDEEARRELAVETNLLDAVKDERFELAYQPWIDPRDRRILGFSALVRWRDPELGTFDARDFVGLAEGSRAILAIGNFVVTRAIAALAAIAAAAPEPVLLSINIGEVEVERGALDKLLVERLRDRPELASRLRLELPGDALSGAAVDDHLATLIAAARTLGVGLHADHRGGRNVDVERAIALGLDGIRLPLLPMLAETPGALARVANAYRGIVSEIVIERVETAAQEEMVATLGPGFGVQGYRVARPMPLDAALALLGRPLPPQHDGETD